MSDEKGQWYYNSNPDPFAKEQDAQWTPYNEDDNNLIEQCFKSNTTKAELQNYTVHFEFLTQIHKYDHNKQRQVKREVKEPTA